RIDRSRHVEVLARSLPQLHGVLQQRGSEEKRAVNVGIAARKGTTGRSSMKYRKLGQHGPTVSVVGLGAGSATTNFGERDDEVQIATVHRAMDLGVTLFDTADRYMKGRHERMLGRALKGRRDKVTVCSKFGNIDNPDGTKAYNGRPEYVREACDASLKQLGIETIDLYYLHRIDPEVPIEETVGAMAKLVEAGRVRYLGLSEAGPNSLRRAAGRGVRPAQVALAWLLSRGEDVVPIPGTKQQKWLEQNVAAVDIVLDESEIATLSATFNTGARAGDRYEPGYFVTLGA